MMSKSYPPQAGPECYQEFGLDYQPIEVLLHCNIEIIQLRARLQSDSFWILVYNL